MDVYDHPVKCVCDECLIEKFPESDFAKSGKRWTTDELAKIAPHYKGKHQRFSLELYHEHQKEIAKKNQIREQKQSERMKLPPIPIQTLEQRICKMRCDQYSEYKDDMVRTIFYATKPIPVRGVDEKAYEAEFHKWVALMSSVIKQIVSTHEECNCCESIFDMISLSFIDEFKKEMGEVIYKKFKVQEFINIYKKINQSSSVLESQEMLTDIIRADRLLNLKGCKDEEPSKEQVERKQPKS